ncbi:hypothetical protein JM946_16840 [Steroidobacter sp. S1-65]|uniref:Uncharacterized protein n=1 Tax=Steroidobacter gossypii TaxID=2805490 RepID=A0ABS1WZK3_9GAMM|nr:hypothetical protein [Steroidobacter gossypii]MBM0106401.1 hypothetical protein [Steroidobacter gossypii]
MNAAAYSHDDDAPSDEARRQRRVRFEVIFASLWLAFGLFVLPALIFWVGSALLGAYGENAGLSTFYVDFYGDLADASGRAWIIALGPLLLIYLLRAIFIGVKDEPSARRDVEEEASPSPPRRAAPKAAPRNEPKRTPTPRARVEPRIGRE